MQKKKKNKFIIFLLVLLEKHVRRILFYFFFTFWSTCVEQFLFEQHINKTEVNYLGQQTKIGNEPITTQRRYM